MSLSPFLVQLGKKVKLSGRDPEFHDGHKHKAAAKERREEDILRLRKLQDFFNFQINTQREGVRAKTLWTHARI